MFNGQSAGEEWVPCYKKGAFRIQKGMLEQGSRALEIRRESKVLRIRWVCADSID